LVDKRGKPMVAELVGE
jgi:hypothetical protein